MSHWVRSGVNFNLFICALLVQFCPRVPKSWFILQQLSVKNSISESGVLSLPTCFFRALRSKRKTKTLLWKFVCVLLMDRLVTCIPVFFIYSEYWILYAFIFLNHRYLKYWRSKCNNFKTRDCQFIGFNFTSVGVFSLHFTSIFSVSGAFECLHFLPKMAMHNVTKASLSRKKIQTNFLFFF